MQKKYEVKYFSKYKGKLKIMCKIYFVYSLTYA